jgi:hypothetical protein
VELAHQLRFGAGAVLEIDDEPVESGPRQDLGVDGGAAADERSIERLAREDPGAKRAGGRLLKRHVSTSGRLG